MAYQRPPAYPEARRDRAARDSRGNEAALIGQVLERMDSLSGAVGDLQTTVAQLPTREDLKTLVQRDLYDAQRAADQARLVAVEQQVTAAREGVHRLELAEAQRMAQFQAATQQQLGVVAQGAQAGVAAATRWSAENINKILIGLVTLLGSALIGVLSHLIR